MDNIIYWGTFILILLAGLAFLARTKRTCWRRLKIDKV